MRRAAISYRTVAWLAASLLAGCAAETGLIERLGADGVTVARDEEPLVFARTEARYSVSARDYLYLGPVETNRQGVRDYYLWVGVATTLDRGYLAPAADRPQVLYLSVQGEPIEFVLRPWHDVLGAAPSAAFYATAVHVEAELAARVTLQQLQMLADHPLESVAVATTRGGTREYFRWETERSWADFIASLARR